MAHNPGSNHLLILLRMNHALLGPLPFKFELMWFEFPGFLDKLKSLWAEISLEGSASCVWAEIIDS